MSDLSSISRDLLAGSVGGGVGMVLGHPLDTIKVRLQQNPTKYKTAMSCFLLTLRGEGPLGLMKGLAPPLLSVSLFQAVAFAAFGSSLSFVSGGIPESEASTLQLFVAGSISGAATVAVTTPTDLLKIKLQLRRSGGGTLGDMAGCAREVYKSEGFRGFFRGTVATAARDTWSTGLYFCLYHELKRFLGRKDGYKIEGAALELLSGGLAGSAAWGACLPADVVKTRLQAERAGSVRRGWVDTLTKIKSEEGLGALFKGGGPLLTRAFFVNAVTFFVYEECIRTMKSGD